MTDTDADKTYVAWALLVLMLPAQLWQGLVLSVLWGWFVGPLGAPAITWTHAAGLLLLTDVARLHAAPPRSEPWRDYFARWITTHGFGPLLLLGLGWVIHTIGGPR